MKKLLLISITTLLLTSCGKSKEEQMLYDYQANNAKEGLNMNVEDLNLEIEEVKKVKEIKASDSIKFYKDKLSVLWNGDDASEKERDTLSYDFVITQLDTLKSRYQQMIILNIKADKAYENYEWESKRDNAIDAYVDAASWKSVNDAYLKDPDSILSIKYKASYSINNPMLNNAKQSFSKFYYTDASNEEFIKEESID